jgi:hypothetical protein
VPSKRGGNFGGNFSGKLSGSDNGYIGSTTASFSISVYNYRNLCVYDPGNLSTIHPQRLPFQRYSPPRNLRIQIT